MSSVPFKRELHKGMHGQDVRALQRALHKADCRDHPATADFGRATRRQVIRFQRHAGISRNRGIVKQRTWDALQPYFDGYDSYLVSHLHVTPPITDKISKMLKVAWWYYGNKPHHYYQQRPMQDTAAPPNVDWYLDCSEFVYVCAKAAGLPDPSGFGYTAYGNTDSFLAHMKSAAGPAKGRLAFYDDPGHVVIITGQANGVWMCLSHGSEGGPGYYPINYRPVSAYRTFE